MLASEELLDQVFRKQAVPQKVKKKIGYCHGTLDKKYAKKHHGPPTGGFHAEWCPDEGEGFGPPQAPAPSITSFGI